MTGTCEVCGNEYDKAFEVIAAGAHHVFESFECAIHALAPHCEGCGCHVLREGRVGGTRDDDRTHLELSVRRDP